MNYTVTATGTYAVAGVNAEGEGPKSANHVVTITPCETPPPGTPHAITGANANVCPSETVNLSIGTIEHATSYQWYKDGTAIANATANNYTVTVTGTYAVAGVNAVSEGPKSGNHVVTITAPCPPVDPSGTYEYTAVPEGSIAGNGTPSFLNSPGPSTWSTALSYVQGGYKIAYWPAANTNVIAVYVDWIDGESFIDNYTKVAQTGSTDDDYSGYFDAIYRDGQTFYAVEECLVHYDVNTKTFEFSGTYDGHELLFGVYAWHNSTGALGGGFTEGYPDAKLVITPSGKGSSPVITTGSRSTPSIKMTYNQATGLYEFPANLKFGGKVKFDPAKFERK